MSWWHVLVACKFLCSRSLLLFFCATSASLLFPLLLSSSFGTSIVCWNISVLDHSARLRHTDRLFLPTSADPHRSTQPFLTIVIIVVFFAILQLLATFFSHNFLSVLFALQFIHSLESVFNANTALAPHIRAAGLLRMEHSFSLIYTCIHCNQLIFLSNASVRARASMCSYNRRKE